MKLPGSIVWTDGIWGYSYVTAEEIIKEIKTTKYSKKLLFNSTDYSILKTNSLDNPEVIYLTVPIEWISNGGNLEISFVN
ncbi:hypothetical protein [Spiroplasma floricola]|uniref:Uncharacterized protein n=1 Tax=Spiroplasma floricola 23-6 TaxID=1336749 RepID=A0A2K8SCT9_9MOLU|nr:hypothetical protein [Spiroplasma floricola]AUB31253.1 hypothetical protein SFLOR_v1c01920 [Spiroplasma floricola 23-6]